MLTATYSMVAIFNEQKNARTLLSRAQHYLRDCLDKCHEIDFPLLRSALETLTQFDQYCHQRKVEVVLIPAVRGADRELDNLLVELDTISARAMDLLISAKNQLRLTIEQGFGKFHELFDVIEQYCDNLLARFDKEDQELLPMVTRLLPFEQWFEIGAQLLSADDPTKGRRVARALPLLAFA